MWNLTFYPLNFYRLYKCTRQFLFFILVFLLLFYSVVVAGGYSSLAHPFFFCCFISLSPLISSLKFMHVNLLSQRISFLYFSSKEMNTLIFSVCVCVYICFLAVWTTNESMIVSCMLYIHQWDGIRSKGWRWKKW